MIEKFINVITEEAIRKKSIHVLHDDDFNKKCSVIEENPVDITPKIFRTEFTNNSKISTLNVYPVKDLEEHMKKSEQLVETLKGIKRGVFEIRKTDTIQCAFIADEEDNLLIETAYLNSFPNSFTKHTNEQFNSEDKYFIYDFIPDAPFYKAAGTYNNFVKSPLNILVKLFSSIKGIAAYQIIFTPLPGICHNIVREASDSEWLALRPLDNRLPPSFQSESKRIEYKSPDFKSYFSVSARVILSEKHDSEIKAFISNFSYGNKPYKILDNSYSQEQIKNMLENKDAYHTGFLMNSHELTSFLHIPSQVLDENELLDIFSHTPVGDKPLKQYTDIKVGTWACGNSNTDIRLPKQLEIPHVHILGVGRTGKSVLLSNLAINKFLNNESVFVLDPHGDLIDNLLRMLPENRIDDIVLIDFGLENATPQIRIRENCDINNPSKIADDMSESMKDISSGSEKFWGPKMAYYFSCLYFIYSVCEDLKLTDIRLLVSPTTEGRNLRKKIAPRVKDHPIIRDFLNEISYTRYENTVPVINRLSHLLLDEKSLRLFTLDENKISIKDIMDTNKLCLVNLSTGIIGKQRSSILSGLMDSLINNNALARASIPYNERKPVTIIKDEFYLGPGDLEAQLTQLAKYNLSVIFVNQYLDQVTGKTKEVMAIAGTRICFKLRRKDAESIGRDFRINPEELTNLKKFQAIMRTEDQVVKINTPHPVFPENDFAEAIRQNCLKKYYFIHKNTMNKGELALDEF